MYTIIIFILIGGIIGYYMNDYYHIIEKIGGAIGGSLSGMTLGLFVGFVLHASTKTEYLDRYPLYSFDEYNSQCECTPYLGLNNDSTQYILKYKIPNSEEPDKFQLKIIQIKNTTIKFTTNKPYVEQYNVTKDNSFWNYFTLCYDKLEYVVYIPKNSEIIEDYFNE